jgi:5-methyltetrahydropteroyltriglutamate--homocysteine methyltransferase
MIVLNAPTPSFFESCAVFPAAPITVTLQRSTCFVRSTLAVQSVLDGEIVALSRKAVEMAMEGNVIALRICLDRLLPRCRERPLSVALPALKSAEDSVKAMAAIAEAVSAGEITLGEASEMVKVVEGFLPVAAPASVIPDRKNEYYKSDEECLHAIGAAMRTEYKTIVDAGFLLQLDDARAAVTYDRMVPPGSFDDYRKWVAMHMEVLNQAIAGLPPERIRYHVCWGSWPGPHTTDVPLSDIVDLILSVRVGAYVIEGANPRHEHEWQVWRDAKLGPGQVLIPGVISHATNVVEHPELVAERIVRLAKVLGRENVIAGTDCGFAQGPFYRRVHPSVMWAKLEALSEGARLASKELWS